MATIRTLHKSISEMVFEEALELIRKIRTSRSVQKKSFKPKPVKESTTVKATKSTKSKPSTLDLVSSLASSDRDALIAMLKGETK